MLTELIGYFMHIDQHLASIASEYGLLIYIVLFLIIFAETGLVIAPLLPGDSLLFAAGSIAAIGSMNIWILLAVLTIAAILGDSLNYSIGQFFGPKIFRKDHGILFNKKHLITTEKFYEKHGTKTIIIARFLPIIRTFAPFIAGIGKMNYAQFLLYNVIGAVLWVFLFTTGGYLFGNIPIVRDNFGIAILAIVAISFIPIIVQLLRR